MFSENVESIYLVLGGINGVSRSRVCVKEFNKYTTERTWVQSDLGLVNL